MKRLKTFGAALGALLLTLAPACANAERVYFLVGVRHVYRIGLSRDEHLAEREEIEKTYADQVASDQALFQKNVDSGADKVAESDSLNADLDKLAEERDQKLGAIFELRDDIRDRHPELRIKGDGPYQVMGIDLHTYASGEVIDRYVVYEPWPGYVVLDGCYYGGWVWGVPYEPGIFFNLYLGWFGGWGGGRFCGGFYGHHGPVFFAPHGYVGFAGHGGGGYGHGYESHRSVGMSGNIRASGFGHSSGYSHSGGYSHASSTFSRSSGESTRYSGYSHGSVGSSRSLGNNHEFSGSYSRSSSESSRSVSYSSHGFGSESRSSGGHSSEGGSRSSGGSSGHSGGGSGGHHR